VRLKAHDNQAEPLESPGMKIFRAITEPLRPLLTWEETWEGEDGGLIQCWERGRQIAEQNPALSANAKEGHLIPLAWKGGLSRSLKVQKYGTFKYLATWQGLRQEDLDIDMTIDVPVRCSRFQTTVIFTSKYELYANSPEE
jgi:hypothetical protein